MSDAMVIDALEDLFESERSGLLSGDLDRVLRLAERKNELIRRLPDHGADSASLDRLRRAAARNSVLLAAATQGVRAAADRVRGLLEGAAPLTTYDDEGRRMTLTPIPAGPIRRA